MHNINIYLWVARVSRLVDGLFPSIARHRRGLLCRPLRSVPRCSLRGRSGARDPHHARAEERAARGSGWLRSSHPLRCAPRLGRRQVGTGKQARQSNRKAGFVPPPPAASYHPLARSLVLRSSNSVTAALCRLRHSSASPSARSSRCFAPAASLAAFFNSASSRAILFRRASSMVADRPAERTVTISPSTAITFCRVRSLSIVSLKC